MNIRSDEGLPRLEPKTHSGKVPPSNGLFHRTLSKVLSWQLEVHRLICQAGGILDEGEEPRAIRAPLGGLMHI